MKVGQRLAITYAAGLVLFLALVPLLILNSSRPWWVGLMATAIVLSNGLTMTVTLLMLKSP